MFLGVLRARACLIWLPVWLREPAGVGAQSIVSFPACVSTYSLEGRIKPRYAYASLKGAKILGVNSMLSPTDEVWARRLGLDVEDYAQWRLDQGHGPSRARQGTWRKPGDELAAVGKLRWLQEDLGMSKKDAERVASKVSTHGLESMKAKLEHLGRDLGVSREQAVAVVARFPETMSLASATITSKLEHLESELHITREQAAGMVAKHPSILNFTPATIRSKAEHLERELRISRDQVAALVSQQPQLLSMTTERLSQGIECLLAQGGSPHHVHYSYPPWPLCQDHWHGSICCGRRGG